MEERYITRRDIDGHTYLIKLSQLQEFEDWCYHLQTKADENWTGFDFDRCKFSGIMTFTNPVNWKDLGSASWKLN